MAIHTGPGTGIAGARNMRRGDQRSEERGGLIKQQHQRRGRGNPDQEELDAAMQRFTQTAQQAGVAEIPNTGRKARGAASVLPAADPTAAPVQEIHRPASKPAAVAATPSVPSSSINKSSQESTMTIAAPTNASTTAVAAAAHQAIAQAAAPAPAAQAPAAAAAPASAPASAPVQAAVAGVAAPAVSKTPEQITLDMRATAHNAVEAVRAQAAVRIETSISAVEQELLAAVDQTQEGTTLPTDGTFADIFRTAFAPGGDAGAAAANMVMEVNKLVTGTATAAMGRTLAPVGAAIKTMTTEVVALHGQQAVTSALLDGTIGRVEALEKIAGHAIKAAEPQTTTDKVLEHVKNVGAYAGFVLGVATIARTIHALTTDSE